MCVCITRGTRVPPCGSGRSCLLFPLPVLRPVHFLLQNGSLETSLCVAASVFMFFSLSTRTPHSCVGVHTHRAFILQCVFPHILCLIFTTACEKGMILLSSQAQRGKAVCPKSQSDQKWWNQEYQVPLGATPGAFSPEPGPPLGHTPPPSPCQPHLVTGHP